MPPDGEKIEETVGSILAEIRDLLQAIALALGAQIIGNAKAWDCGRLTVHSPDEPNQFPPIIIPSGYQVVIRALLTNTGKVYIAPSKDYALKEDKRIPLEKKDHVSLKIDNTNLVWVAVAVADEGVDFIVEKAI